MKKKIKFNEDEGYCKKCGTCGYIGCCGVRDFLDKHVKGKTDCPNEKLMIADIISYVESYE